MLKWSAPQEAYQALQTRPVSQWRRWKLFYHNIYLKFFIVTWKSCRRSSFIFESLQGDKLRSVLIPEDLVHSHPAQGIGCEVDWTIRVKRSELNLIGVFIINLFRPSSFKSIKYNLYIVYECESAIHSHLSRIQSLFLLKSASLKREKYYKFCERLLISLVDGVIS